MSAQAGEQIDLNIGIGEVRMPINGVETSIGPRIVVAIASESVVLTPQIAREVGTLLFKLAEQMDGNAS